MKSENDLRCGEFEMRYAGRTIPVRLGNGEDWHVASLPIPVPGVTSKRNDARIDLVRLANEFPFLMPASKPDVVIQFALAALRLVYPTLTMKDLDALDVDSEQAQYIWFACCHRRTPQEVDELLLEYRKNVSSPSETVSPAAGPSTKAAEGPGTSPG